MTKKVVLIICWILFKTFFLFGQEKYSKKDLIQMIKEERYEEAYSGVETQYQKFPKDPDYIYYAGVCRVQLSQKIPEAIQVLTEAAHLNTHKDSWFYLGKAYMLHYNFAEAEEAFSRFNDKAAKEEKEKVQLSLYLAMCRNALDICTKSKKLNVLKIDTITESNLLSFLNKQQTGGRFEKVEEAALLSSKVHQGVRFTTSDNTMSFQTKYSFGKKYRDIFIAHDEDIELGKFKSIGNTVNSPFEEDFVFYDPTGPAMYFSSQGHNCAGGLDIFRSYYDKKTQKWSEPANLGFPVNTPYDEIAYVTLPGTERSLLASRRNAGVGKLVVYTLEKVDNSSEEEILSANAEEIARLKIGKQSFASISKKTPDSKKSTINTINEAPPELRNEESYQRLIHEALNLQIRSDSIRRISDEKKESLISAKYESDKTRLWQEIKILDTRADEIQQKADVLYKKARELEAEKQGKSDQSQVNTNELAQKVFSNKSSSKTKNSGEKTSKNGTEAAPATNPTEKMDIKYRIQVGVFSKPQQDGIFKGFTPVYKENTTNGSAFKYYVGLYRKITDAEKGLVKVKGAGFKDAYIIGFYNGKIVPLSRATELELSLQKH